MISSEQDVAGDPEVAPNAEIAFGSRPYDTIMQGGATGAHGEVTGLLLGVPAHEQDGLPRIVVGYALKLSVAADGAGFLLDQQAIDELAALTASGEPAFIVGWFYADPGLAASPPHISFSTVQVLMPADGNLFALINPATNEGACYLWDGAHYQPASIVQDAYAGASWTGEPKGAADVLGDLLAPVMPPTPAPEPTLAAPSPARAGRITAPIAVGAQGTRTDDTIPIPAFLSRKYNLGALSLTSAWPEWTRQVRPASGGAVSALSRNRAALFPSIDETSKQAAIIGIGAFVSIAVGTMLVLAGLYSVLSAPQNSVVPTPTVPIVAVAPSPSATQVPVIVVAPTSTPSTTPTETILDTATATIEPTPIPVDTDTPVPTRRPAVPTDTPLPEPPPPPTIEVAPTDTLEPAPTDTVEESTATPIEATATPTVVPTPVPTRTPVGPPLPTQRPTPMPGIFTPTPEAPTITPLPGIFTPPPAIEPTTPTPET